MKKVLSVLMVAVALMMAAPAQAQLIKFGVKGGMDFSELDFDKKDWGEINESSTGFFIGPMAEFTLPIIGLGIDGALMFSQRTGTLPFGPTGEVTGDGMEQYARMEYKVKQQGIEIPINLKYTLGLGSLLGVYIAVGPDFFFNFKDLDLDALDVKKAQVALNLGAGLKLLRKLQVGVTYQIPMGDSFKTKDPKDFGMNFTAKNKTWQASIAYIF